MDHYKGAVFPPNEAERMETFNAIGLGNAPHDPTTARLCHVLSKLLQVSCCTLFPCHCIRFPSCFRLAIGTIGA